MQKLRQAVSQFQPSSPRLFYKLKMLLDRDTNKCLNITEDLDKCQKKPINKYKTSLLTSTKTLASTLISAKTKCINKCIQGSFNNYLTCSTQANPTSFCNAAATQPSRSSNAALTLPPRCCTQPSRRPHAILTVSTQRGTQQQCSCNAAFVLPYNMDFNWLNFGKTF